MHLVSFHLLIHFPSSYAFTPSRETFNAFDLCNYPKIDPPPPSKGIELQRANEIMKITTKVGDGNVLLTDAALERLGFFVPRGS